MMIGTCNCLCSRPTSYQRATKSQIGSSIDLQLMFQWFVRFAEFNEMSASFKENFSPFPGSSDWMVRVDYQKQSHNCQIFLIVIFLLWIILLFLHQNWESPKMTLVQRQSECVKEPTGCPPWLLYWISTNKYQNTKISEYKYQKNP